jgi:hypothetical protein
VASRLEKAAANYLVGTNESPGAEQAGVVGDRPREERPSARCVCTTNFDRAVFRGC